MLTLKLCTLVENSVSGFSFFVVFQEITNKKQETLYKSRMAFFPRLKKPTTRHVPGKKLAFSPVYDNGAELFVNYSV